MSTRTRVFSRQMNDVACSFARTAGEGQCKNADMKQQMERDAPRGRAIKPQTTPQIDTVNTAVPLHDKIVQVPFPVRQRPPLKCNHARPNTYLRRQNLIQNIFNTPREIAQPGQLFNLSTVLRVLMTITDIIIRFQHVGVKCCSWSGLCFHCFFGWLGLR